MKKLIVLFFSVLCISCGNETVQSDCFRGLIVNESLNLELPEFNSLRIETGNTITVLPQSGRKVLIIKSSTTQFNVFDLECPKKDCGSSMTFDGLLLKCPCTGDRYSWVNGGAPVDKDGKIINNGTCFALEYNASLTGNNILKITR